MIVLLKIKKIIYLDKADRGYRREDRLRIQVKVKPHDPIPVWEKLLNLLDII